MIIAEDASREGDDDEGDDDEGDGDEDGATERQRWPPHRNGG